MDKSHRKKPSWVFWNAPKTLKSQLKSTFCEFPLGSRETNPVVEWSSLERPTLLKTWQQACNFKPANQGQRKII